MTESVGDNIPTVDKIVYIEHDDQTLVSDTDNDNDDLHVCRKCNKVFKNLSEYLEHKVKYENYRISQTRSKLDRRMVLPQLVQKQKRKGKKEKLDESRRSKAVTLTEPECVNSSKLASFANFSSELPLGKEDSAAELNQENNLLADQIPKKRGRKRKSMMPQALSTQSDLEIMYLCTICDKRFRREATLRWHMKYEHKDGKENGEDSDDEIMGEVVAENDGDFRVDTEKEENGDHHFEEDEHKTPQEIHVIIEQPQNIDQLETATEDLADRDESSRSHKQIIFNCDKEAKGKDSERPFICDICSRRFKEMTVLKAHSVVHSDERKFICTAENCPYGFKTKGGLVRHMRRHTGERPYACENCGRAFSESGALTRHMKSRRNCAQTPDSAYPRYMKNWTYHPNIPAVIDPSQRDAHQGRSTLQRPGRIAHAEEAEGEIHYLITRSAESDIMTAEVISSHDSPMRSMTGTIVNPEVIVPELIDVSKSTLDIKLEPEDTTEAVVWDTCIGTTHDGTDIITVSSTDVMCEVIKPLDSVLAQQEAATIVTTNQVLHKHSTSEVNPAHDSSLVDLKSNTEVQFIKLTQCCVCKKDLGTIDGLEIHLRSHLADQPSRCGLCHFLSHDREELRHHILSMHYDSLNDIETSVLSMEEDVGGMKTEDGLDKKATTRDALIAVKQLYSLKKQKSSTEVEKSCPTASGSLQCMVCNRFFRGSSYLRQHMRTHTGDRPHSCHVCHRSFTSRDILKKHMYVHKEQRDFKCGECGKLFKRLAHVQQHLKIHSQERSYRCSVCDKLFKTQNSLTVHMRTHSGVNPYKCHVCSRHFRERGSLQRHMRLHTGEKPYKCPLCNRAFAEHGTLSRHLKAKVPCSGSHSITNLDHNQASSSNMLTQFSTVVANTQQYIQHVDSEQQFMLPTVQEMGEDYVVLDTTGKGSEEMVQNIEVVTEEGIPHSAKRDGDLEVQETESLHIFDSDTGESVIIVAEKSIVDLIREQQLAIESGEAGSGLQKIKDILHAVGNITSVIKEDFSDDVEPVEVTCIEHQHEVVEPGHKDMTDQKNVNISIQKD